MKTVLLSLLVFALQADKAHNFLAEDGRVKWQKVYWFDSGEVNLTTAYQKNEYASNFHSEDGNILFSIADLPSAYEALEVSKAQQPLPIRDATFSCDVMIETKTDKYRVTLSNITVTRPASEDEDDQKKKNRTEEEESGPNTNTVELETFALNSSGTLGHMFEGTTSEIMDYTFDQFFNLKVEKAEDDW